MSLKSSKLEKNALISFDKYAVYMDRSAASNITALAAYSGLGAS